MIEGGAGLRVLDLYAGSGAVGLEALSRGAAHVTLVESAPRTLRVLRDNVRRLGLPGAEVVANRVERLIRGPVPGRPYDLVFVDPPYALEEGALATVLAAARDGGWLADEGICVVERATRGGEPWPPGFVADKVRRYGDATLWYGRAASPHRAEREPD